ncbi:MAG: hypothetical protein K6U74_06425 [Firmicutes bacterium]|nr:hypothetical protein [Bacillota bacterium]
MIRKLLVVILASVVTAGFWFGSQMTVKQKLKRAPVVIAAQDIPERTQITEEMVGVVSVPVSGIPPGVARRKDEVVGKYTMSNYGVPKNSYFFTSIVKNPEEMPDGSLVLLKPGEEMVALNVDLQKYLGGNAVPGNLINLWFSAKPSSQNKQPVVGKFMENVRIVGARDQKAAETLNQAPSSDKGKTPATTSIAKVLLLAVPKEEAKYVFMAQAAGQVYPTGINESISPVDGSAVAFEVSEARKWLEANIRVLGTEQQQKPAEEAGQQKQQQQVVIAN